LLSFLSAILLFITLNYVVRVALIYRGIDKYLFFTVTTFGWMVFTFCQMLLAMDFPDATLLTLHRIKIVGVGITGPFYLFTICSIFAHRNVVAKLYLAAMVVLIPFIPFDIFLHLPINHRQIDVFGHPFTYNLGGAGPGYTTFSIIMVLALSASIILALASRGRKGLVPSLLFSIPLIGGVNDYLVTHKVLNNIMVGEYAFFIFIIYIYVNFVKEDQRSYQEVKEARNEAERRLRITEVYTRKSIVDIISQGADPTSFKPEEKHICVLFSDIRDFTHLAESLTPIATIDFLNTYFDNMNEIIKVHQGEIDKLIGDCIMAVFNQPDAALNAAIAMRTRLNIMNRESAGNVNSGIGINYGKVISGNIGSMNKMDYTVIGDVVNSASRIESLTKYYGLPLLISDELLEVAQGRYHSRFIDRVLVKGKKNCISLFEIFDHDPAELRDLKHRHADSFAEAFKLYEDARFQEAEAAYQKLKLQFGLRQSGNKRCMDPIIDFYIDRCKSLEITKAQGNLGDWRGVYTFMDK
jgi:class 3 adenylate cyclase